MVALALLLYSPGNLPAFIGAWVALKFALNWKRIDHPREHFRASVRTGSLTAMIGSVASFGIAIAVGAYIKPASVFFE